MQVALIGENVLTTKRAGSVSMSLIPDDKEVQVALHFSQIYPEPRGPSGISEASKGSVRSSLPSRNEDAVCMVATVVLVA